jgi:hypothetical protein
VTFVPHRRLLCAVAAAAAPLVAGCGADDAPSRAASTTTPATAPHRHPAPPRPPALCGRVVARVTGHVAADAATELSGLAVSRSRPGVLWANNDSGDRARVLAFTADGAPVADLDVPGAEATDWEDLAAGAGPSLYLADIGDNREQRATVDVYRVPEPAAGATGATAPAARLRLRYPDGAHDAETLLVRGRELAIVTKQFSGESGVYVTRWPAGGPGAEPVTLRRAATLHLGLGGLATGGDVSADGRVVAVRTYTNYVAWTVAPGATLAKTLARTPCRGTAGLGGEGQGEALALSAHGSAFFTVPEGSHPAIRRYSAARR